MDALRREKLERAFNPRVVAVVGDKGPNYTWLRSVQHVKAKVYSVQIDPNEIPGILEMGHTNLSSLKEIPEPVDYVICAVPRPVTPRIVQDCIDLDVGAVALFTAGFAETQEEEGMRLQERLAQMAREANLNLVGPNCMTLYHGKAGLRTNAELWVGEGGHVSVIAQSGHHTNATLSRAWANGLLPHKGISMGNGIALDHSDWLEYLDDDPETEVIVLYAEGVRDGQRLFRTLRQVAARKPVLVWKGGQNPEGMRTALSHTASLTSSIDLWDAMIRQSGAIRVDTEDEMIDTLKALRFIKPMTGNSLGLIGSTGGQSVAIADAFGRAGFVVPPLDQETLEQLSAIGTLIGGSYRNPLDMTGALSNLERIREVLDLLRDDGNVDAVGMEFGPRLVTRLQGQHGKGPRDLAETLAEFQAASSKPFLTIVPWAADEGAVSEIRASLGAAGVAVFDGFREAADALRRVVDYHRAHAPD